MPLVASGFEIGDKFRYPASGIIHDFAGGDAHPLVMSYKVYRPFPYDRPTWDLTSVLYAIEPDKHYFDLSPSGRITIVADGKSIFAAGQGDQRFLIYRNNRGEVPNRMVQLVT